MRNKRNRQVFVEYRDNVTKTRPLKNRTYTMTHSDETGDLFVVIGLDYATDKTNELQDQVYLKWTTLNTKDLLYGEVLIDGNGIEDNSKQRYNIFKREMPLALQAIYIANQPFFDAHPELLDTPILIDFKSSSSQYNKLYSYGAIGSYNAASRYKTKLFH